MLTKPYYCSTSGLLCTWVPRARQSIWAQEYLPWAFFAGKRQRQRQTRGESSASALCWLLPSAATKTLNGHLPLIFVRVPITEGPWRGLKIWYWRKRWAEQYEKHMEVQEAVVFSAFHQNMEKEGHSFPDRGRNRLGYSWLRELLPTQKAEEMFRRDSLGSSRSMPSINPGPNCGAHKSADVRWAVRQWELSPYSPKHLANELKPGISQEDVTHKWGSSSCRFSGINTRVSAFP